jgi:hypothetical protein
MKRLAWICGGTLFPAKLEVRNTQPDGRYELAVLYTAPDLASPATESQPGRISPAEVLLDQASVDRIRVASLRALPMEADFELEE